MKFGPKTEPKKCSRCFRTKEEAIKAQKESGKMCDDSNCTFKIAIKEAIAGRAKIADHAKVFKWQSCPDCGTKYYKTYSRYCHICGKARE